MRLQLGGALFLFQVCCSLVLMAVATSANAKRDQEKYNNKPLIYGPAIISSEARAARIAEFVSSHKIPDNIEERKDARQFDNNEEVRSKDGQRNFEITRPLYDEQPSHNRKSLQDFVEEPQHTPDRDGGISLSSLHSSSENPTTMLPVLTTQESKPFDFIPVNVIHEENKGGGSFFPFNNKNFEDLSDISLIPAGSNTRIQVKKGPNGKDYEYEYVYYYYDEEDEDKSDSGVTASNSQEAPTRTSAPSNSRRVNSNRNKYSTLERTATTTTTVEPVLNEVIPSGNSNRARQLEVVPVHEEVTDERLPTNTRFPPRSRSNLVAETTERANRGRGNRQRTVGYEIIDSSSFRSGNDAHPFQEGPEFPQNLPNGPVRFLGVTPNEGNEEKTSALSRGRNRPQRLQESTPVQENNEEVPLKKLPVAAQYENIDQYNRNQSQLRHQSHQNKDIENAAIPISANSSPRSYANEKDSFTELVTDTTDSPVTQVPDAMDKVALDLYAFLQQGRSNLVDFVKDGEDAGDTTDASSDNLTTDLPETTFAATESDDAIIPTTSVLITTTSTSTTSSLATTTITTTTPISSEEPSVASTSRTKFRRPSINSPTISRNKFKSHIGGSSLLTSTESTSTETATATQRSRGRFGANSTLGTGGFKRARPSLYKSGSQTVPSSLEEPSLQKENTDKLNVESKSLSGRGRYRANSARSGSQTRTTVPPTTEKQITKSPEKTNNPAGSSLHRLNSLNKLGNANRRRGNRPVVSVPGSSSTEEAVVTEQTSTVSSEQENNNHSEVQPQSQRSPGKLAVSRARVKPLIKPIIKPGVGRLNLRPRPGQEVTSTTTENVATAPGPSESDVDEPASEGTEEETREAPADSSPAARLTTANPLNKLRNRNRIQIQPKTTTARTPLPPAARRSHLLPRRKITEAPTVDPVDNITSSSTSDEPADSTESPPQQQSHTETTTVSPSNAPKPEEVKGLSSLLASRRRLSPRKPGQLRAPSTAPGE